MQFRAIHIRANVSGCESESFGPNARRQIHACGCVRVSWYVFGKLNKLELPVHTFSGLEKSGVVHRKGLVAVGDDMDGEPKCLRISCAVLSSLLAIGQLN